MDLSKLSLGDKIVGGTSILLLISLLFFPWHRACADLGPFGDDVCVSRSALESPNGFWGILALLLTLAVLGVLIADRIANANLPELPVPWNQAIFFATVGTLVVLLLKLVIETDGLGWGAWISLLLAAGMAYGGFLLFQDKDAGASVGGSGSPPQSF